MQKTNCSAHFAVWVWQAITFTIYGKYSWFSVAWQYHDNNTISIYFPALLFGTNLAKIKPDLMTKGKKKSHTQWNCGSWMRWAMWPASFFWTVWQMEKRNISTERGWDNGYTLAWLGSFRRACPERAGSTVISTIFITVKLDLLPRNTLSLAEGRFDRDVRKLSHPEAQRSTHSFFNTRQ